MKIKKTRSLQCYICKIIMKCDKMSNLRRHLKLHGPFIDSFQCDNCGRQFQNKNNFKNHAKKKHCDIGSFTKVKKGESNKIT